MKRLVFPLMLAALAAGCASPPRGENGVAVKDDSATVTDDRPYSGTSGHIGIGAGRWGGRSGGSIGIGIGF